MFLIFIDAGHGLAANGKTADNGAKGLVTEREEVRQIAREALLMIKSQPWFNAQKYAAVGIGVDVPMTLTQQVDEVNRIHKAMMPDKAVLVSVHANSGNGRASGVETWYEGGNEDSRLFSEMLQKRMTQETGLPDRGIHDDRTNRHGRLGIVRDTYPTSCLVECGFVDNPRDAETLRDGLKDDAYARAITGAVSEILGQEYSPIFLDGVFADVAKDRWSAEAIRWVKEMGIMRGDGTFFRPTDPVTREELAVILKRFSQRSAATS